MNTDGMSEMEAELMHSIPSMHREKYGGDFVVGIDFGGTKIAIASADLEGNLLEQARIETEASQGAMQAVERALALARSLMSNTAEKTGGRCIASGAVSPGIVLPDRILLAPNVPGWEELALLDLVQDGLAMQQVAVGTDAKASAAAEFRWGSLQGADPAMFLSLGTGVSVALIAGGKVLRGAHGACGEIGYSLRGIAGEPGFAQGHAPLEEAVGGRAIGERGSKLLGGDLSAAEVFESTDARARSLVEQALDELALHVTNIAILIDPSRIAVGGGLMGSGDRILDELSSRLRSAVPFPPELVAARFLHDSALRGAVSLALDAIQR